MFADSLLDSQWERSRRGWTTLAAFGVQAFAVSSLLLLPLLITQGLPQLKLLQPILAPTAPPPAPPPAQEAGRRTNAAVSNMVGRSLLAPPQIPTSVANIVDHDVPPPPDLGSVVGVRGGTRERGPGVLDSLGIETRVLPPPPPRTERPPRLSRIMEGNLVYRLQPEYPPLARQARIQGPVVLRAVISKEGMIENLQVVTGHPMLAPAAINAVRQWRYRPYMLNGEPIEVETQVTVNFVLSGG